MAIRKIEHVGIMVSSMERSLAFYQEVIGLELQGKLLHTNGVIELAFLGVPGTTETVVELIAGYTGELSEEGRVHHIAFTVDDLDAETERVAALGVRFLEKASTTLPNGARYRFFYGPDGERIELFQPAA
ncbi:VOC family protein [Paenibacillus koleovorans]|uniref:VOC family protein n=1 Tax=Paenibacillus koleovorans TaxID=121608 RepID=UPI000FDB8192|nr:VOC family protein [Paenibacillus koleovorans]